MGFQKMKNNRKNGYRSLLLLVSLVALLTFSNFSISQGQASIWSQPIQLGYGWFPDITTDQTGRLHVVWAGSTYHETLIRLATQAAQNITPEPSQNYDVVQYSFSDDAQTWSNPSSIIAILQNPDGNSYVTRPFIDVDSLGIMHMTYRTPRAYYSQAPVTSAADPNAWSLPYRFSTDQIAYFTAFKKDSLGRIHLFYTEVLPDSKPTMVNFHLFYRYSDDNGVNWSSRYEISTYPLGTAKPQIYIAGDNSIHVVWETGPGGDMGNVERPTSCLHAVSFNRGENWNVPQTVSDTECMNITINGDGAGGLVMVYMNPRTSKVNYQTSTDGGRIWSIATPINTIVPSYSIYPSRLDDYATAVDSSGNIHLVLSGIVVAGSTHPVSLLHLIWNGSVWSDPEVIFSSASVYPEWPRIAVSNGNQINVVFFVRPVAEAWNSDKGDYQVWYVHGSSISAYLEPSPWATITSTPQVEAPTLPPTLVPTALPTNIITAPIDLNVAGKVFNETDELLLIGKSILPALLFLIVIFIIVRVVKRF